MLCINMNTATRITYAIVVVTLTIAGLFLVFFTAPPAYVEQDGSIQPYYNDCINCGVRSPDDYQYRDSYEEVSPYRSPALAFSMLGVAGLGASALFALTAPRLSQFAAVAAGFTTVSGLLLLHTIEQGMSIVGLLFVTASALALMTFALRSAKVGHELVIRQAGGFLAVAAIATAQVALVSDFFKSGY